MKTLKEIIESNSFEEISLEFDETPIKLKYGLAFIIFDKWLGLCKSTQDIAKFYRINEVHYVAENHPNKQRLLFSQWNSILIEELSKVDSIKEIEALLCEVTRIGIIHRKDYVDEAINLAYEKWDTILKKP